MKTLYLALLLSSASLAQARLLPQYDVFEAVSVGRLSVLEITRYLLPFVKTGKLPELHRAVILQDTTRLYQLIQAGADVNEQSKDHGWSPLHVAVLMDNVDAIKILSAAGAKGDVRDTNDDTPVEMAALWGRVDSLHTLFADVGGVPLPEDRSSGETLLHLAVRGDAVKTVAYLLNHTNLVVDAPSHRGKTPLMATRSVEVAELLFKARADISKKEERNGSSPASYAAFYGNAELVQFFLEKQPDLLFTKDVNGFTLFLLVAWRGFTSLAIDLIAKGAKVDDKDRWGNSVLQLIADSEDTSHRLFAFVLHKVSDINSTNEQGNSVAHNVAEKNDKGLFDILLRHNELNLNLANQEGDTPLTLAAKHNKSTSVEILLQHGADASHKNHAEMTAFLSAVQHGASESAAILLKEGDEQQLHQQDAQGNNALHVLVDAYINPRMLSDRNKFTRTLALLVEHGLDINSTDAQGNSILHKVNKASKAELVNAILARGGNIDLKNAEGKTPIDMIKERW